MTFTSHIFSRSRRWGRWLAGAAVACALLIAAVILRDFRCVHGKDTDRAVAAPVPVPVWREAPSGIVPAFGVMRGGDAGPGSDSTAFLAAFRFAGTFFLYGPDENDASLRRGVLSYLPESRQEIVSEGSIIGGVRVKRLFEDRIVLEKDGEEGVLSLGGGTGGTGPSYSAGTPDPGAATLGRTRFGEQTGDGVWTMDKAALMDYYEELLEDPARLLNVFDSMRPLYGADGTAIEGYELRSVGESGFFEEVGFREGDVVRKVNALPMTNRGRAEFFIRQVVQDRLSAVVIDIEREGGAKRLVYQLR